MGSTVAMDRGELGRLALKVAEEFDKTLSGERGDRSTVHEFAASLSGTDGPPLPAGSVSLQNYRTIGAFSRAWQRAYNSGVDTVEDLNKRVRENVAKALELLEHPVDADKSEREQLRRFFLSLHRELLIQQFPPRRIRRPQLNDELIDG